MDGPPPADPGDPVVGTAADVLRLHIPDVDGWCAGCLAVWNRIVPHPCPQVEWAAAIHAAGASSSPERSAEAGRGRFGAGPPGNGPG